MSFKSRNSSSLSPHPNYPTRIIPKAISWNVPDDGYLPPQAGDNNTTNQPSTKQKEEWKKSGILLDSQKKLPLNPMGRTGLAGKGVLNQYGPNKISIPIITRFDPTSPTSLQLLAILRTDINEWSLPECNLSMENNTNMDDLIPQHLQHLLPPLAPSSFSNHQQQQQQPKSTPNNNNNTTTSSPPNSLLINCGTVYEGYGDDPRNTDHAWYMITCTHFHMADSASYYATTKTNTTDDNNNNIQWIDVDDECEEFSHLFMPHKRHVIGCLMKNPHMYANTLSKVTTDATSLIALISNDLENKINSWNERVQKEKETLLEERAQLEKEKLVFKNKSNELRDGTAYLEKVLNETLALKQELQTRLSSVPLDLDTEALRKEWNNIKQHKEMLTKTERALEAALDKLADAQAAMDVAATT
jgi:hypothetical protein